MFLPTDEKHIYKIVNTAATHMQHRQVSQYTSRDWNAEEMFLIIYSISLSIVAAWPAVSSIICFFL